MGTVMDYRSFIRAFESLIESHTLGATEKLYNLEQYTTGDVKDQVRSCYYLSPEEGCDEAKN